MPLIKDKPMNKNPKPAMFISEKKEAEIVIYYF